MSGLALRLAPYALAAALALGAAWWAYGAGRSAGAARAEAACLAAQEAARRAHEIEVARIADAASVAEAEALAARRDVQEMTDALRRQTRPACPVSDADAGELRRIIDAARPASPGPSAR